MKKSMGGKPFGKAIRVSPMPKAPDGKSLPAGLPKADVALSKRHRKQAIAFHSQHAAEHMAKVGEHRAALKNPVYNGVNANNGRKSLSDLIAGRQAARDGSAGAPPPSASRGVDPLDMQSAIQLMGK